MGNSQKLKKKNPRPLEVNPLTSFDEQTETMHKSDKNKKSETNSPERTIETMFRITSINGQRLSDQADTKAHILISVNAIIISILLTAIVRRIDEYANLIIPVLMILLVSLGTIIFSILATRPAVSKGIFNQTDLKENKVNLLFFGNFFKMDFDNYSKSMLQVMGDKQSLYLNLLRNLHEQAVVLGRKYAMLKIAYNIFMYGVILSVIVFLIASTYFPGKNPAPLNLITNAFYAVTEKKKVSLPEGKNNPYESAVSVSTKKLKGKIEIKVSDNGDGITEKILDKIFQPFFTTNPPGQGTGLGLSLSYDIIKAHGGELKVETKEHEGAEFIIILPQ